ncbi:MAG: MarR family transcriptional regulator [Firmicutes bacterium]|nr:MarR family transcriptional regulator [Bacillota bacterium]
MRHIWLSKKDFTSYNQEGYIKAADLSEILELSRPSITRILNSLECRGYIVRNIDKKDRRSININLTETGIEALEKANRKILQIADRLVAELGEADTDKLIELIKRLTEIYKRILEEHGSSNDE